MCGIAGIYNFSTKQPVDPGLIERMCDQIVYRGPDDAGVYTDGPVGLGHRRLSILDLSELGHQPMPSTDKTVWITYNGEVYNFPELKKDLEQKGYNFKSNCDTEVIINLYLEYGKDCLDKLRGMFAFAIWDSKEKSLFLARDRIGKKPLFYFFDGTSLIFASEIKCILQDPRIKREINFEAFYDYFQYMYVPDPKTIYKNIFKLKPGHFLLCSAKGIDIKEYWDVSFTTDSGADVDSCADELLSLLDESVRIRQISDVPLGAFLSGGIDSSGVVALMAQQRERPVTTCSIGFEVEKYDETRFAKVVAEQYKTDHHEFTVHQDVKGILRKLVYHFDEPFADASAVPTYYVSKLARQKVTVALSGDGGDENFAGYEKYHLDTVENRLRSLFPDRIRTSLFPILSRLLFTINTTLTQKASSLLGTLSQDSDYGFYLTNTFFKEQLWQNAINDDLKKELKDYDPFFVTKHYYHKADTDDHLSKILYTDLKTYLTGGILVKVDRMSMANSLEVRAPILDHKVIEFAASLPSRLKYFNGEKKYILKQAFRKILTPEIMYRKKMGFSPPVADWLRGELHELARESLLGKQSGLSLFFKTSAIQEIWNLHQSKKRDFAAVLWHLLMFELWFQEFMA